MDDNLQNIFAGFDPPMSSDADFMKRLNSNLDLVELIKMDIVKKQKNHKAAVIIAACAGFFIGVLLTVLYPLYSSFIINAFLTGNELMQEQVFYINSIIYCAIAFCIISTSLVTFDITKSINMSNLWEKTSIKSK